tara:strand:+ start:1366 stop:1479 length:114 start_codon:yes stop_codon:yes gene_type:complete
MLNQESGQSSLNQTVLIPVGTTLNKRNHGLLQGLWKL